MIWSYFFIFLAVLTYFTNFKLDFEFKKTFFQFREIPESDTKIEISKNHHLVMDQLVSIAVLSVSNIFVFFENGKFLKNKPALSSPLLQNYTGVTSLIS